MSRKKRTQSPEVRSFYQITEEYLSQTYERYPQWASRLGLSRFHGRLGSNTAAMHQKQLRLIEKTLNAVENLAEDSFYGDDWLDRRCFLAWLRTEILHEKVLRRRETNPQIHCEEAVDAIFHLLILFTDNLRKGAPFIEARLARLPNFLKAGLQQIRNPVPLWTRLAQQMAKGSGDFLSEIEAEITHVSSNPTRTKRLFSDARKAFKAYGYGIGKKKPGAIDGYQTGRPIFETLIRERLGISTSIEELEATARAQIRKISQELKAEARRIGKQDAHALLEEARKNWKPSGDLRARYEKTTFEIRDRLRRWNFVSLPAGESLKVMDVPPFLRTQFPTAAYSQPGAFERKQQGIFWVNDLGKGKPPEAALRERQQHFGLELTCAHEAYPGHHLQFVIQNRHPSRLRRLFAHAIFYEGWTLWCEKLTVEKKLIRHPHAKLLQLHDSLWRAYRIVIDCGLHSGKLNIEQAVRVLMRGVGFTKSRAQGEINWYSAAPTVPMSYLLGRLEVERLFRWFTKAHRGSLLQFNDWLLSHGAVPPAWIWEGLRREQN